MGFGYGRTTYWQDDAFDIETGRKVAKVSNQVGHLWNAQRQTFARSSNGNLAFRGDELYSYGTGWIVAKLWQGAALINSEKYSVTTSSHESEASGASRNRLRFFLPALPDSFARSLSFIAEDIALGYKESAKKRAHRLLSDYGNRAILRAAGWQPDESQGNWDSESHTWIDAQPGIRLGEFIATQCGIRLATWRKIDRDNAAREAREAAAAERKERLEFIAAAKIAADSEFYSPRVNESWGSASRGEFYSASCALDAAKLLNRYRVKAGLSDARKRRLLKQERALRSFAANFGFLRALSDRRKTARYGIKALREFRARWNRAATEPAERLPSATIRSARDACQALAAIGGFFGLHGKTGAFFEPLRDIAVTVEELEFTEREEARRIEREERAAAIADNRRAWLAGEPVRLLNRFDSDHGGAALRVRGDVLETSWGANVPLSHAIKVFKFVKLCRETGQEWRTNGRVIRVGHFQVDSISATGDFVAGCHRFSWPEIERAAIAAGVFDAEPSAEAVQPRDVAA